MKCPVCKGKVQVIDIVHNPDDQETYRAKQCTSCNHIFYTVEYEAVVNQVFEENWAGYHRRGMRVKK